MRDHRILTNDLHRYPVELVAASGSHEHIHAEQVPVLGNDHQGVPAQYTDRQLRDPRMARQLRDPRMARQLRNPRMA